MIRILKFQILRFNRLYAHVGGNDKSIDQIILEIVMVCAFIRLIKRPAGRHTVVRLKGKIISKLIRIDCDRLPEVLTDQRICACVHIGKSLIKVTSGNHIISFLHFQL